MVKSVVKVGVIVRVFYNFYYIFLVSLVEWSSMLVKSFGYFVVTVIIF